MENVKKFYDALSNDKAMQDRAIALNKEGETTPPFGHPSKEGNNEAAVKAAIVAFAQAEGYTFTEAELDAYAKQAKPLADESLDAAAGGDAGCGCVGAGGGGGTDKDGNTFVCACVVAGAGGADTDGGENGVCLCGGIGAGAAT